MQRPIEGSMAMIPPQRRGSSGVRFANANHQLIRKSDISTTSDSTNSTEVFINEDKISQRRRADLEHRLSTTLTRTHSSLGPSTSKEVTSTLQHNPSSGNNNKAAIRRRRKCQPLHRCESMNESVSSILKPSKYSTSSIIYSEDGDNTAATHSAQTAATKKSPRRFLRRWSAPSIGSESSTAASTQTSLKNKSQNRPSSSEEMDEKWVADGVDFCNRVEIHVSQQQHRLCSNFVYERPNEEEES